jgi:hypothetical protein
VVTQLLLLRIKDLMVAQERALPLLRVVVEVGLQPQVLLLQAPVVVVMEVMVKHLPLLVQP